jgi:UDP-N-acetylglucosamine--N-acetylmuramyl-(pentapeptide) pyrophosphoryl-undecaprenol N-acetylglucosamine transferase
MRQGNEIRVIISGGGTGGHIFPAIAIAKAIQELQPKAKILFVGAIGKMEMEKVPEAGFSIEGLWISGFQRSLSLQNLGFPFKLMSSLLKARSIIKKFKPQVVVGVGGFASGPTLNMATHIGIPTLIQEQNSYPGITNKLLAQKVNTICVAYEGMEKYFPKEKIILTGNPIRQQVVEIEGKRNEALSFFGLQPHKKTILVVGGSLGAQSINRAILSKIEDWRQLDAQLIWQTGKTSFAEIASKTAPLNLEHIKIYEFIQRMDLAYAAADLIISRAGAIAISEISAVGKPVVFVPYPHAAEDHQTKNAQRLVERKAALLIRDSEVNMDLYDVGSQTLSNSELLKSMAEEIKKFGINHADRIIAQEVIKLTV